MVCAAASHARAWDLRCVCAGAGAGPCDWAPGVLCGGMLLRERDASFLGRGVSQSAGESDHGDSAERAAGADAVVRVGREVREFLLPDVARSEEHTSEL